MTRTRYTWEQLTEHRWQVLALTCVGALMVPLGGSSVAIAVPALSGELHLSFGQSMWVQAAYLTAMAVMTIPLGRMADQHGRFRYYLIGCVIFTLGALLCALSVNGTMLICMRIVQGLGGALQVTTSIALVTAVFPPGQRGRAIGFNTMAVYIGLSLGPTLGGLLVDGPGWRWVFFINVPIGLAVLAYGWWLRPTTEEKPAKPLSADLVGATLQGVFLIALLVPMTLASSWGWGSAQTIVCLVVAAAALLGFIVAETRVRDPLLDLDLIRHNRVFAAANLASLLSYTATYACVVLTAVFLEVVQGRSAAVAGVSMIAAPITQAVLAPLAGRWSDRVGSRLLTTAGMLSSAFGFGVLALLTEGSGLGQVIAGLVLTSIGTGLFASPNNSAIVGSVPRSQLGLASGFLSTTRTTGQAMSMGVLGGIAASALGPIGGRIIFMHGSGPGMEHLTNRAIDGYAHGYSLAMWTAVGLALAAAAASLTRGRSTEPVQAGVVADH
jgi:EmrB/QacA subfamily drug resistance transporter